MNNFYYFLDSFPDIIYKNSMNVATIIASKLKEIGDAYKQSDTIDKDYLKINNALFEFLEKLRKKDKRKFDLFTSVIIQSDPMKSFAYFFDGKNFFN